MSKADKLAYKKTKREEEFKLSSENYDNYNEKIEKLWPKMTFM